MPLTLDKVQEYQRIPGTLEVRLIRTNPYVRIVNGGAPPIFIQGGVLYTEGGQVVTDIPDWFTEEVAKLSPLVRAEVGLNEVPEPQPKPQPKPPKGRMARAAEKLDEMIQEDGSKPEPEQWTCQEPGCGKTMPKRGRTFHVLHHAKQAKKEAAAHGHQDG